MSIVAFERKKAAANGADGSSAPLSRPGAALAPGTGREREMTENGNAQLAEPWLVEGEELFVQFVPQLAAFARSSRHFLITSQF
jgi:hypothetical protein